MPSLSEYSVCQQGEFRGEPLTQPRANDLVESMDYFAAPLFLKLLLVKTNLVEALKDFNQQAARVRESDGEVPAELRSNTLVLLSFIERVNVMMRSVATAFRLRGTESYCNSFITQASRKWPGRSEGCWSTR